MITLLDMVSALQEFDKYKSIACFADDVSEIRMRTRRDVEFNRDMTLLTKIRPGLYRFDEHLVHLRKCGVVEVSQDVLPLSDLTPYFTLCVQRAEKEKNHQATPVFGLLKRTSDPGIGKYRCFILQHHRKEWEAYSGGYTNYITTVLWPEG